MAIFGNVRETSVAARADRRAGDIEVIEKDRPRSSTSQSSNCLDQFGLAVALDAGNAEDLAGRNAEAHVVHGIRSPRVRNGEAAYLECGKRKPGA